MWMKVMARGKEGSNYEGNKKVAHEKVLK